MLLHFDGTLIVIAISFIIFAIIMHHVFYVPMRRVMEERDEFITDNIKEAKKLNLNTQEILKQYNSKINKARLAALETIEKYSDKGKEEKSKIVGEASKKAQEEIISARQTLTEDKEMAIETLKGDVAPLAQQIVSKILNSEVSVSGIDSEKVIKILKG